MAKICVVDSGYNREALSVNSKITGIDFISNNSGFLAIQKEIKDDIRHGTAVVSTIFQQNPEAEIIVCKIFDDDYIADQDKLLYILNYIEKNIDCDILNMSFGITECHLIPQLKDVCQKISRKGTSIIAAFDNNGGVSYPACFEHVIGVDSFMPYTGNKYQFIENSIINIRLNIGMKRFIIDNQHYIFSGSSFASAFITGFISKNLNTINNINDFLKNNASEVVVHKELDVLSSLPKCKKAVVFPYNKEIHSLIKFARNLPFEITHYFDSVRNGNVGKQVDSFLIDDNNMNIVKIENINNIIWNEDFDMFILGHQKRISMLENKNYEELIIEKCKEYGKTLFSFDRPASSYDNIYFPHIKPQYMSETYKKMYQISTPVVGIFGTSSSQGKFTLQMALRNMLLKDNYNVGQLGTEPQSELFGFDCVYPCGYNQKINLSQEDQALVVNQMMAEIDKKNVDIILCGSQSGTVPYIQKNIQFVTYMQMIYSFAIMPDISILCVNAHDDTDYVQRTINFLQSIENNQVFALAVYPKKRVSFTTQSSKYQLISEDELKNIKITLEKKISIPAYIMDDSGTNNLYNRMIKLLS